MTTTAEASGVLFMGDNALAHFLTEHNLGLLAPEFIIVIALLFSIGASIGKTDADRQGAWWLSLVGIFCAFTCLMIHFFVRYAPDPSLGRFEFLNVPVFYGMFQADLFAWLIRTLLVLGSAVVLLMSRRYIATKASTIPGEFYVLLLTALLGGMMLAGASDLIMVFVALETLGIASYIMAGYLHGDSLSAEASLKYLVYGGASSAVLLFGFSLLYGFSGGTTQLTEIAHALMNPGSVTIIIPIMLVMIIAGFAFKLSAAPFHMWAPDVYEGSPTPVTAFLSVVSKTAGFAVAARFLISVMGPIQGAVWVLLAISVLSMLVGNIVALTQKNIKRLLAYSTIAHAGYMILGLAIMNEQGLSALLYYLIVYLFMNLGAFAFVIYFHHLTGSDEIRSYAGLVRKQPFMVFVFSLFLLSLAGIPITAGFFAKFFLFQAVASAGAQYLWLVVLALVTSTISLYYYLNVIRLMVVAEPSPEVQKLSAHSTEGKGLKSLIPIQSCLLFTLVGTLALGFFADPLMALCLQSSRPLLAIRQTAMSPSLSSASITPTVSPSHIQHRDEKN
jgi:NAD(P)H-quinone oxidoreductase subunit 2